MSNDFYFMLNFFICFLSREQLNASLTKSRLTQKYIQDVEC